MNLDTYKEFRKVNRRLKTLVTEIASLMTMVAALVDEGSDKAAAKQLAALVSAKTKALQDAIPK